MGWLAGPPPPPPPVDRQTPVKTVPSRRTTYAGGNERIKYQTICEDWIKDRLLMVVVIIRTDHCKLL